MDSIQWIRMVGGDMGILPGPKEDEGRYVQRVALSACSAWMLTALYDDDGLVSVIQIHQTVRDRFKAFQKLYPTLQETEVEAVYEYLYNCHLANGSFYHRANWIRPPNRRLIGTEATSLLRGMLPEKPARFSGMSPYLMRGAETSNVAAAFDLPEQKPESILQTLWTHGSKQSFDPLQQYEYLNVDRRHREPYYLPKRRDRAPLTLLRQTRNFNERTYYVLSENLLCRITDDSVHAHLHQYARLAIMNAHRRQHIQALHQKNLITLDFSYRLPEPDLRFTRLVAWPSSLRSMEIEWEFFLSADIWPIVKARYRFLGYEVEERGS